jgi:DNA-binding transcriptional MocR family regulator
MLKQMHLNIIEIPTTENGIDISYLEMIIRREPVKAGLFTANFNNPTGKTFSEKVKFDLVKLFQHNNIPLIEDDIYGDVHFDRARPRPLRAYSDSVILCSSFSKTLAPGLRVGWVAGAQWFERIASRKSLTSKFTALYPQAVIAEFIRSGGYDNHLRKLREKMLFNVRSMGAAILESFPQGTSVSAPTGGFVLWIGLPLGCAESQTVFERAASEGIGIAPGGLFSLDGSFSTYIRLNAGVGWTPETNLVIKRLASLVLA